VRNLFGLCSADSNRRPVLIHPIRLDGADDRSTFIKKLMGLTIPFRLSLGAICERASKSARRRQMARSLTLPASTGRRGISRVQYLAAIFGQRKELRRKPYHSIWMGLLYLTEIAPTNFLRAGVRRNFKNPPPLVLFGWLELFRGKLALPMAPYLGHALLFGWPLTLRRLLCMGPALLHRPPLGAFRFLASRA
jgi:hypothetical protein